VEGGGGEGEWEWGIKLTISVHCLAQGEGQGGGLRSLPLVQCEKNRVVGILRPFISIFYVLGPKKICISITFSTTSLIKLVKKFSLKIGIDAFNLIELLKLAYNVAPSPYNSKVCGEEGGWGCHRDGYF
jgi:hypothetical protein